MKANALRRGDRVRVKSAAEILGTLDESGALDALPFMPEMVPYCGRTFTVTARADKICDTIQFTRSLQLRDSVLLDDLRCDGADHGGCQAECRFYWKEDWLEPAGGAEETSAPEPDAQERAALLDRVRRNVRKADSYKCQATEAVRASVPLRTFDPRPYARELLNGNVDAGRFTRVMARAVVVEALRGANLWPGIGVRGTASTSKAAEPLGLKPGDWVEVKSRQEIEETLNDQGKNRGLWFDREMLLFCGKKFRIRRRIERLVDEKTGRFIRLKSDCFTLEGAVCSGERSFGRWFCPRAIYPYWRECWLRRSDPPAQVPFEQADSPAC
ncbi:MAG TPA: hypothetical protein VE964_02000 [Myxococcales bacterium]|nr:hypothetical protein [Myxococcales bacterium]